MTTAVTHNVNNADDLALRREMTSKRKAIEKKLGSKLIVNPDLNRRLVSFQGNKQVNGQRWCSYKEGFSSDLVQYILEKVGPRSGCLLDPFCGSGTALFKASKLGLDALGIELLPNSLEIVQVRKSIKASNALGLANSIRTFRDKKCWRESGPTEQVLHLRITDGAYPSTTEHDLGRFIYEARRAKQSILKRILLFAAMCTLEGVSFTRKDGQYLRWDSRSGRNLGKKPFLKASIQDFTEAISAKLTQIADDIEHEISNGSPRGKVSILAGSCLNMLPTIKPASIDGIITSPPYCNRYDYTRTYALELAFLGVDEDQLKALRQNMLSCTVENREKNELSIRFSPSTWKTGVRAFEGQDLLQSILAYLDFCRDRKLLNNTGIARMVRNYFFELSIIIADCRRVLRTGAPMVMVNDNVQYQGVPIPVDLILSDIASQAGFEIEKIWILASGKGNSSQQMGRHGRNEARKCVYLWRAI